MKKVLVSMMIAFFLVSGTAVFADNVGTGLGRVALQGKSGKGWELLGTFLNALCGNGTFAITTGTLGYRNGARIGMNEDVKVFVAQNMDSLATDLARGEGEYLDTLANLMQIEDKAVFNSKMKANFNNIYTSYGVSSEQVVENIYKVANS